MNADQYLEYMFYRAGQEQIPLSGTFELTCRCNFDCRMCYIHRSSFDQEALRGELTTEQWLQLADRAAGCGMLTLLLTGGEPLIRPDFPEIYQHCREQGILVSVNSNASLMTEADIAFFAKNPPRRLNITLYGSSPETYGRLCGNPDAYNRVTQNVLALHDAGVPLKLNVSVTPYNVQELRTMLAFAKTHEIPVQATSYMFPPLRAAEHASCAVDRLSPEAAARAQMVYDVFRFSPEEFAERRETLLRGEPYIDPDEECLDQPTEHIRCRAGKTCFWVTWDGQMRPCGMMQTPTAALGEGFDTAWRQTLLETEKIVVPAKCTECQARQICGACPSASYAETGDYRGVPEYLCRKTKAYLQLLQDYDAALWTEPSGV